MKKVITYLSVSASLLFGALALTSTTVKADSLISSGDYVFAATRTANATDLQGNIKAVLPAGSAWRINGEVDTGNLTSFQVAPGMFVSLYDGYIYLPDIEDVKVTTSGPARLYDHNAQLITDRALGPDTEWYSDRLITLNHKSYYRVATDEFVAASDVAKY
jgi:hypothetical protein